VHFELERVKGAILKLFEVTGEGKDTDAEAVAAIVFRNLLEFKQD